MQTIKINIEDDYVSKVVAFLKLLPEKVAKIEIEDTDIFDEDELLDRVNDIKEKRVKTLSRDEVFGEI